VLGPAGCGRVERAVFDADVGAALDEVAHEFEVSVVGGAVECRLPVRVGVGRVDVEAELDHQLHGVGPVPVGGDTDLVRAPADRTGNDRRVVRPEPLDGQGVPAHA